MSGKGLGIGTLRPRAGFQHPRSPTSSGLVASCQLGWLGRVSRILETMAYTPTAQDPEPKFRARTLRHTTKCLLWLCSQAGSDTKKWISIPEAECLCPYALRPEA